MFFERLFKKIIFLYAHTIFIKKLSHACGLFILILLFFLLVFRKKIARTFYIHILPDEKCTAHTHSMLIFNIFLKQKRSKKHLTE